MPARETAPHSASNNQPATPANTFAADVLAGLSRTPKALSSKYFYDETGSRLFERIMDLPEYYPTRCEWQIFENHKHTVLKLCQGSFYHLVDLGAGDAAKTRIWIDHFYRNQLSFEYIPVDISKYSVEALEARLHQQYPRLQTRSVAADYLTALEWIQKHVEGRKLVLFLGSNIGNFSDTECRSFLLRIRQLLRPDDRLLIGFDLKKEAAVIHRAYNDSQGVTEAFNKNLLHRINTELGGEFNPDTFDFYANYDPVSGFVRSYLISTLAQRVRIKQLDRTFEFTAWEPIHTENSRKFSVADIEELALACGYTVEMHLSDEQQYFADSIWRITG
jgi:L-histidine Nalpha-methyltransferase